jgi:glutamate-5-semialdehyde dehydrogenase
VSDVQAAAADLARRARDACPAIAAATTDKKNGVLRAIASALTGSSELDILHANNDDVSLAKQAGLTPAMIDRLTLDRQRLEALAAAVLQVEALRDPVGRVEGVTRQPSGIEVGRMRVPLGAVLMVYESRPNVTIDAAALCLKSGNAVILRGGREAQHSNAALHGVVTKALHHHGLPETCVQLVQQSDRELLYALLKHDKEIDLVIPRGGTGLIDAIRAHATIPVIQHYQGICHVYVHENAKLDMAERIAVNAKVQRAGVCNAMECLVVDQAIADVFLPRFAAALAPHGVELRADARALPLMPGAKAATESDYDTEFLALVCAVKVVDGLDDALVFLRRHGSHHTEAIVTEDEETAHRFLREVDASCVLWNASTRFNDGGELGLGAELGISTTKLHAYGPMGLQELCTRKFVVLGRGETRGTPP